MLYRILCRIRFLPQLAYHRRKSLVYPGLVIEVQDSGSGPIRLLVMLSLTEAMIYLESHPTATLHISEDLELPRGEPQEGLRPERAGTYLKIGTSRDSDGLEIQSYEVNPCLQFDSDDVGADFSRVPFVDPGGRWPMKTEDVTLERG